MSKHGTHSTGKTIQVDVGPGDQTGTYYIVVSNLPFDTSWQALKDFVKEVCEVDHVEVFNASTAGWVRVLGRDNFDQAWDRLNGGVFGNRCIIAKHNATERMKIRELFDEKDGSGSRHKSAISPRAPRTAPARGGPWATASYTPSPAVVPPGYNQFHGIPDCIGSPISALSALSVTPSGYISSENGGVPLFDHGSGHWPEMHHGTDLGLDPPLTQEPVHSASHYLVSRSHQLPDTEGPSDLPFRRAQGDGSDEKEAASRKIVIKHISNRMSDEDMLEYVNAALEPYPEGLRYFCAPGSEENQRRGHAYAGFETADMATHVLRRLNGHRLHGKDLEVRYVRETSPERRENRGSRSSANGNNLRSYDKRNDVSSLGADAGHNDGSWDESYEGSYEQPYEPGHDGQHATRRGANNGGHFREKDRKKEKERERYASRHHSGGHGHKSSKTYGSSEAGPSSSSLGTTHRSKHTKSEPVIADGSSRRSAKSEEKKKKSY